MFRLRHSVFIPLALLVCLCMSARIKWRRNRPKAEYRPFNSLKGKRPNILLIIADDLGHNDVGYNNPVIQTPTITRLARSGVILKEHYAYAACSPSRAALMTGRYAHRIGMQNRVLIGGDNVTLPLDLALLPQELKRVGYKTSLFGKWHLGQCSVAGLPTSRGFDEFFGFLGGGVDYYNKTQSYDYIVTDLFENAQPFTDRSGTYIEDLLLPRAKNAIRRSVSSPDPFFLVYSTPLPHNPQQVPSRFINSNPHIAYDRRLYLGMLSALDNSVRELERTLIEAGKMQNTVIVFLSDNGGFSDTIRFPLPNPYDPTFYKNFFGPSANNFPYRSGKGLLYEGGIRTPAFIHSPLLPPYISGSAINGLFHISDWMPTIMNWAGIPVAARSSCRFDGVDQTTLLSTPYRKSARSHAILSILDLVFLPPLGASNSSAAIRDSRYKYTRGRLGLYDPMDVAAGLSVVEDNQWTQPSEWKAIGLSKPPIFGTKCGFSEADECLFDLRNDPSETVNLLEEFNSPLYGQYLHIAMHLKTILNREPIAPPINPVFPRRPLSFPNGVLAPGYCDPQNIRLRRTCTSWTYSRIMHGEVLFAN